MPELPTCLCVAGMPPYDRLTAIYQAAAELSGDSSLPDSLCVAGVSPFQRFAYIYAAFRVLADDDSLPSMECVEGESFKDQVTRIYEAAFAYADDSSLTAVECVRGTPIWQQWVNIYAAIYSAQGEPEDLPLPGCVNAGFDVLTNVFCALIAGCVTPTLESATISSDGNFLTLVFSTSVTGTTGFTMEDDGANNPLTYSTGSGTNTLVYLPQSTVNPGVDVTLDYNPGNVVNGDCPLATIVDFVVTNNSGNEFTYLRPGGVFTYFRPGGVDQYIRP